MLKKYVRIIVLIVVVLCLIIAVSFVWQKFWMHPKTVKNVSDNPVGLDEAEGVTMMVPGSTQNTYWELHIHKIETTSGDVDHLNQIEGVYFMNKAPFYHLTGNQGAVSLKTRKIEVSGNVILKATDGSKELTASQLVWETEANKVTAQKNVILKTQQAIITTEEVVANLKLDHADFNGQTQVSYQRTNQ
ncbi:MAG TPA: LPS export ABC transporter periplasmic protein LptC [Firmicutes bacterium]|jgi:LPS export ABC transporter protein LptC|nr:LPS export ABC transporter periplasmic protein LptC [Bacillota bacterium]